MSQNSINNKVSNSNFSVGKESSMEPLVLSVSHSGQVPSDTRLRTSEINVSTPSPIASASSNYANGNSSYSIGVDGDDSSNFKVTSGADLSTGVAIFRSTNTGIVTKPNQPAFSAFLTANILNVTGNGTSYTVIPNQKRFDVGNNYNNTTGIFTAPVAGFYVFGASIGLSGLTSAMTVGNSRFQTNTGNDICIIWAENPSMASQGNNTIIFSGTCFRLMAKNETVIFVVQISGGALVANILGSASGQNTNFYGYLLH